MKPLVTGFYLGIGYTNAAHCGMKLGEGDTGDAIAHAIIAFLLFILGFANVAEMLRRKT